MMRKILGMSVVAAMLCVASSALAAPGVNLAWVACHGEAGAVSNRTSTCLANTGSNVMVCSFEVPADLPQISGNELVLDILTTAPSLPAWWDMKNPGSCRPSSLLFNALADGANVVCADWAAGASSGGIGAYTDVGDWTIDPSVSAQHRRIKIALAVPGDGLVDLTANTEYFSCNVTVNNLKSTGAGNCVGCDQQACIVLNTIKVTTQVPANDVTIGNASTAGSNIITWQGPGPNCQSVPTKNQTWGQVKALYR